MTCGIYLIVNLINNKFYVGSAVNCAARWKSHKHLLRYNKHYNNYLQNSYNKYGEENFGFSVLEEASEDNRIVKEQFWLDYTKCYDPNIGYNVCRVAGSTTGYKHTEETMKLLIGRKDSEETRKKKGVASKGRIKSPEEIKKTVEKSRGKKRTPEQRARMSAAQKGRKHTEESRLKMSKARVGKHMSDAQKEKLRGNQFNRNLDRWPCPDGCYCKCQSCRQRNYELQKARLAKSS